MTSEIGSAAVATVLLKDKNLEETWGYFTSMFIPIHDPRRDGFSVKTFINGGYDFEKRLNITNPDDVAGVGEVFKTLQRYGGGHDYAQVTEWSPQKSFSLDEVWYSSGEEEPYSYTRTDFNFAKHPEGVSVKITRREKGSRKQGLWDRIRGKAHPASYAAARLCHIVGGDFRVLKDRESTKVKFSEIDEYLTITRDDSLRTDY